MKNRDLEDYVHGLVDNDQTKIAEEDLSGLSMSELEAVLGLSIDTEKLAYNDCVGSAPSGTSGNTWLDQFAGTPLHAKAIQLCEQELALEKAQLDRRIAQEAQDRENMGQWTQRDALRLEKDMLSLELHKTHASGGGGGSDPTMAPAAPAATVAESPSEVEALQAAGVPEEPKAVAPAPKKPAKEKTASVFAGVKIAGKAPGAFEAGAMYSQALRENEAVQGGTGAALGGAGAGMLAHSSKRTKALNKALDVTDNANKAARRPRVSLGRVEGMAKRIGESHKAKSLGSKVVRAAKAHGGTAGATALGATALGAFGVAAARGERAARERMSKESSVQTTGEINNGESGQPEMPRSASGQDSAGRRATPEEVKAQEQVGGDVQFREVDKGTKTAGFASAVGNRVLGKALSSGAIDKSLVQKGLNAAQTAGARLGGKSTESAVGRGLLAAGGAVGGVGALGAGAMSKSSALLDAVEGRRRGPF